MIISAEVAIRELMGIECHGCGGSKAPRMSHCRKCYFSLSKAMQRALYARVGSGYEEAYTESLSILRNRNGLPSRDDACDPAVDE